MAMRAPGCGCRACLQASFRITARAKPAQFAGSPLPLTVRLALTVLTVAIFGAGFAGTLAVFTSTASNDGNTFTAGTVTMGDNDSGQAMLALSNSRPDDSDTSCIRVSYTGSLPSTVRLYGTTTGTGLDPYLILTVTRGTLPADTFDNCTNFLPDAGDYIGAGSGVIYSGTLQAFPDDYSTALVDPTAATPETWTTGESHDYSITVTVADSDGGQGKTATQTFIWEASNI